MSFCECLLLYLKVIFQNMIFFFVNISLNNVFFKIISWHVYIPSLEMDSFIQHWGFYFLTSNSANCMDIVFQNESCEKLLEPFYKIYDALSQNIIYLSWNITVSCMHPDSIQGYKKKAILLHKANFAIIWYGRFY